MTTATDPTLSPADRHLRTPADVIGAHPLRARPRVRDWLRREWLSPRELITPVLIQPDRRAPAEYADLPTGVALARLPRLIGELWESGIRAVKLFCYVEDRTADAAAALDADNLLVSAVRTVRRAVPGMVIATEVCGCAWTVDGECVLLDSGCRVGLDATFHLMADMAVARAAAGADIVGPAAMLEGSVRAVRQALDAAGYGDVGVTPSVIFDSALFGPYKTAMHTNPGCCNRRGLQLDACHLGQAVDTAHRWLDEGADSVLVQPAMMAVDLLTRLREQTRVPITAFSVSGEHRMLVGAGDAVYAEYLRALRRAGADPVMTYGAHRIAAALRAHAAAEREPA
jgi:porphobilinogen synthase